jgi:hypothetical protein
MLDPTREEMLEFLAHKRGAEKVSEFDRDCEEQAIYCYAHNCHHGVGSNLFSALVWSRCDPGPIPVGPVSEKARKLYHSLEREFGHTHDHQQERKRELKRKQELELKRKQELELGRGLELEKEHKLD